MNILVVSDSLETKTGYNTLALTFIAYLKKWHSFFYVGQFVKNTKIFFQNPEDYPDFKYCKDIPYTPITSKNGIPEEISRLIDVYKINLVITFGDIWSTLSVFEAKSATKFKWLHYLLTETDNLGKINTYQNWTINLKSILEFVDYIVPHARMSLKVTKSWELKTEAIIHPLIQNWETNIDHHTKYYNDALLQRNKEIRILVVANNSYRKNLDTILHAFALLRESQQIVEYNNLRLVINIHPLKSSMGWNILQLIEEYKLQNNVLLIDKPLTDTHLSEYYNDCDLFLNASYAEGIGLPVIDALHHNAPVLTLDAGFLKYFVPKHSVIVTRNEQDFYPPNLIQKWVSITPNYLAECILRHMLQSLANENMHDLNQDKILTKFPNGKNGLKWKKLLEKIWNQISPKNLESEK